jgi:hypothetical protein
VQEVGDSRQQTEERLRELRQQENNLLDKILHNEGSMKDLIIQIAKSMKERYELLDPALPPQFALSQISTNISRALAPNPIADLVRRYLPDEFKNTNMQRPAALIDQLSSIIEHCGQDVRKQIEQCSILEIETQVQFIDKAKNINDDIGTILNSKKETLLQDAIRRGMREIAGEKIRDAISSRDYRFEISQDATLTELREEFLIQFSGVIDEYIRFKENYLEYPDNVEEDCRKRGNSARVYRNMMHIVNEKKWSGDVDFWLDRNYWKKAQSSHKSGNSTMFPTTLCKRCSKDIDENPKDFHVTKYDKTSPTGYRCDNCGSTEIDTRFTSREQVGDKGPEIDRMASDIVNHLEYYVDIFKDWRIRCLNPTIQARKRAISNKFRIASMGKEEIVVPRKKNK